MHQSQESQGSRAGLAGGTSLLGFSLVFPVGQGLCFRSQRWALPGRETTTSQPPPFDPGLACESGGQGLQVSPGIMLSGQQLYENKKCVLVPHHGRALETPAGGGCGHVCVGRFPVKVP